MGRSVQTGRNQVLKLLAVLFALPAVATAGDRASTGNSFDSLVILGVGTSIGGPTEFWGTDLVFSNPSSIGGELIINEKPIEDPTQSDRPIAAAAALPALGSATVPAINTANAADRRFTTLYATPLSGFPLPVCRARVFNFVSPSTSVDMPAFRLSTLLALNPAALSFPGAVRAGGAHSNLILANLRQRRRVGETDPGDSVTLLIEAYSPTGALLGSNSLTLGYGETAFVVDVLGAVGASTPSNGMVRVSRTGGTGFFWGVMPTRNADGSLTVSLGMNP